VLATLPPSDFLVALNSRSSSCRDDPGDGPMNSAEVPGLGSCNGFLGLRFGTALLRSEDVATKPNNEPDEASA
jgi:hypothetical protein